MESFRQPAFPGGATELAKFLGRNLQYPNEAADAHVSGRVVVSFWVDETGRAYGFGAVQSPHPALEAEALRVAKKISSWEPGLQEGKPATMQMYLPVVFKLMDH
ncbi:MAG: energy transducer TonB [Hymenobacteraceae bacterium]|nr:energy transducer TonB [Hymenobacteraceae bacterium]